MIESVQPRQATTWRIVAGLMCFGLAANVFFGTFLASGDPITVSSGTAYISRWIPPAMERLWPMLEMLGRLSGNVALAFAYLAFHTIISIVLAVGLWKMKKWAAWIMTFLMLFPIASNTYGIVLLTETGTSVSDLVTFGRIPALAWSIAYVALLWPDWIIGGLREVTNVMKQLRREHVPLG